MAWIEEKIYDIPEPNEEKAKKEALKMYNTESDDKFEIIDNEELNKKFNSLNEKTNKTLKEKERALKALNIIDSKLEWDIDLAYDKNSKLYYFILWDNDIIKNWDLSEDTLELVKALPFEGVDIDWVEEIIDKNLI